MSEGCPLLCEEPTDDEWSRAHVARRPPAPLRGRARTKAKGAAAIIKTWPDHWMSILLYLWIALAMITITVLIIYNSMTLVLLKPVASRAMSQLGPMISSQLHYFNKPTDPKEVTMPVIVDYKEEINLNKFLPYIEIISRQYKDYKYNLLVILNDTNVEMPLDENASKYSSVYFDKNIEHYKSNIFIEKTTLSQFLKGSPIKAKGNHHFMDFLVRALSIWNKGGISFNPVILTPQSPNPKYIKKLHRYLETHQKSKHRNKQMSRGKLFLNNIRDIIDALENGSDSVDNNLVEEENKVSLVKIDETKNKRKFKRRNFDEETVNTSTSERPVLYDIVNTSNTNGSSPNLLPTFFEFLFRDKSQEPVNIDKKTQETLLLTNKSSQEMQVNDVSNDIRNSEEVKDVVEASDKSGEVTNKDGSQKADSAKTVEDYTLTIDLNGNFIATDTPCHAFLGGLFADINNYSETDTTTDYIVNELTVFCKGVLSSCKAIDIIII